MKERAAKLTFWLRDGACGVCEPRGTTETLVSIGRTNSKRALGFIASRDGTEIDFVLDQDQCKDLAAYLRIMEPTLLKPKGRKGHGAGMMAALESMRQPKLKAR